MQLRRRQFLHLAAGATAATAMPGRSRADTYPSRPVRIIVGFSAGSASDIIARLTAQYLSEKLGHQFVVENHPGAATNLAAEYVVRAAPDGYTLLLLTSANTVNATLYTRLNFNLRTDITPVASIDLVPYVMEVTNAFPAKTVSEFIAYAKANPGKINMASNGIGSGPHVAGELFQMMAGVKLVHVAYTGNPYADLIAGQVQMMFSPIGLDRLRAIEAVAAARGRDADAPADHAGSAHGRRNSAGLRRQRLARARGTEGRAGGCCRPHQQRRRHRPRRSRLQEEAHRSGQSADADDTNRIRQIRRRRHRQMGEGDQVRQHQGRLSAAVSGARQAQRRPAALNRSRGSPAA
jgi:Tripartite tricarboxylate transporter family receptor